MGWVSVSDLLLGNHLVLVWTGSSRICLPAPLAKFAGQNFPSLLNYPFQDGGNSHRRHRVSHQELKKKQICEASAQKEVTRVQNETFKYLNHFLILSGLCLCSVSHLCFHFSPMQKSNKGETLSLNVVQTAAMMVPGSLTQPKKNYLTEKNIHLASW